MRPAFPHVAGVLIVIVIVITLGAVSLTGPTGVSTSDTGVLNPALTPAIAAAAAAATVTAAAADPASPSAGQRARAGDEVKAAHAPTAATMHVMGRATLVLARLQDRRHRVR